MRESGCMRSGRAENELDGSRVLAPVLGLLAQLLLAEGGQSVVSRATIVLRRSPVVRDPPTILEADKGRVHRALPDIERVPRHLLDAKRDTPSVERTEGERFQHEEVERTLEDVGRRFARHMREWLVPSERRKEYDHSFRMSIGEPLASDRYGRRISAMQLGDLFDLSLLGRPDVVALEYDGADGRLESLTFGELNTRADRMA